MFALLPVGAEVYLKYKCPKCEVEHILQREETEFPGRILCVCGSKLVTRPIRQINVQPLYGETASKNFVQKSKKPLDKKPDGGIIDDTLKALLGLGYKKAEAMPRIVSLMERKTYGEAELLLRDFLKGE
jgi:phage FluMu protein Com